MQKRTHRGFSVVELMIVVALLMIMTGTVFQLINLSISRSSTEQAKLDMFQEAREFMDQMSRDLHQAGYPGPQNIMIGLLDASPVFNDIDAAVGLVKVDSGDLWFEGDVNGDGTVYVVHYHLDTSTTNGCPCLKRSQLPKIEANPLTGQTTPSYQVEVQGVMNTNIFSAFADGSTGTPVTLPIDFTSNAATIANIDTIQALLTIQSSQVDPQTRLRPTTSLVSTVRLNNCSQAAAAQAMSCH